MRARTSPKDRAAVLIGALVIVVLSGCMGGEDDVEPKAPAVAEAADEAEATSTTGSITGTVTSDLFEPLAGGLVTIVETAQTTKVAKNGFFTINEIEPGTYTLRFDAEGYQGTTRRVEVYSGEVVDVPVQLIPVAGEAPWVESIEISGYIGDAVAWQVAPPPNNECLPAGCSATAGNAVYASPEINATEDVQTHLIELVWEPGPGGVGEHFHVTYYCPDKGDPCATVAPGTTSPLGLRREKADWDVGENGTNRWAGDWLATVWTAPGMLGTGETVGVDVGAAYQQRFTWYISLFHHERAPDGFTGIPE